MISNSSFQTISFTAQFEIYNDESVKLPIEEKTWTVISIGVHKVTLSIYLGLFPLSILWSEWWGYGTNFLMYFLP